MNGTPTNGPVRWYQSQRFIALCQSSVLIILGGVIEWLTVPVFNWRPIGIALASNVLVQFKDWWNPAVIAPFPVMNRNLVQTVSPASVQEAVKTEAEKATP